MRDERGETGSVARHRHRIKGERRAMSLCRCSLISLLSSLLLFTELFVRAANAAPLTTWPAIPPQDAKRAAGNRDKEHIGDDPDDAGPAANLSPDLKPAPVVTAMRTVADWELARAEKNFANTWTWVPLYSGLLETARVTGDERYREPL